MKSITLSMQPLLLVTILTLFPVSLFSQVGIATSTPAYQFEMVNTGVVGATSMAQFTNNDDEGVSLSAYLSDTTIGYNAFEGVTNYLGTTFSPAGVFGLAINSGPAQALTYGVRGHSNEWQGRGVQGSRTDSGGPDTGFGGVFFSDLGYTGGIFDLSDRRAKRNINSIENSLELLAQLNPVSYYFDLEKYPTMGLSKDLEFGFVAQELTEVLPNLTKEKTLQTNATEWLGSQRLTEAKSENFLMIDYSRLIPLLTSGINEQQKLIELQNERINDLEKRLKALEKLMNSTNN